jgi:hypothetical protein
MDLEPRYEVIYRAVLKNNNDPKNLRRIKVVVPQITGDQTTDWIWPVISTKRPPDIGTGTWVMYIGGNPEYPVWIGEFGESPQGMFGHGSFYSTQDQTTGLNTETIVTYNNTDISEGVTLSGSQIKVDYDGTYNFAFSIQFYHPSGGGGGSSENVYVWFKKNGVSIPQSATYITVDKGKYNLMALNLFIPMKITDYVQLAWSSNTSDMLIKAVPVASPHPAGPSVILTVNQIA